MLILITLQFYELVEQHSALVSVCLFFVSLGGSVFELWLVGVALNIHLVVARQHCTVHVRTRIIGSCARALELPLLRQ